MKITIKDPTVHVKSGDSKKTGKPYEMRWQEGSAETEHFRMTCRVPLDKTQEPWPAGTYDFDFDSNVKVDEYGEIRIGRSIKLLPVVAKAAAATPKAA